MKILIIEDHPRLRENIAKFFHIYWYLIETAINWEDWINKIINSDYDMIILDINMPILNWKEFMEKIHNMWKNIPVLALTSNSLLEDKLEMFELWVDDYMTKPFDLKELEARVKVLWNRKHCRDDKIIKIWNIRINLSKRKIFLENKELDFWNKEYLIIEFLSINKWYSKNKTQILEHVWWELEENLELTSTTLEAHISTIRKKLWKDFIKTIKWVWYIIE